MRRSLATTFGRVQVPRRRFRCQSCGRRWCPTSQLFGDLHAGTISLPFQEAAILAGASWPYRVARQLLKRLSGAEISAEELRLLTNRDGKQRARQQQEEAERAGCAAPQKAPAAPHAEQPLLVGLDGGWVCSREQRGGMEGKVAVICSQMEELPLRECDPTFSWSKRGGSRRPPRRRHRLVQRRYGATFGPASQLGQQAKAAAHALESDPNRPVVVIADGAEWIKTEQARHFPQATCILDWAHLWREVSAAIRTAARAKQLTQQQVQYQLLLHRSWLWRGQVDHAVQGLRALSQGLDPQAVTRLTQAITYLENQRDWIGDYEQWQNQGYPVGSGMIERAVALVINRRMKKRGMRWCRANATAVVALRADLLNDDWTTPQQVRVFP